jgi:hypothetical protein
LRPYIEFNINKRQSAKNKFEIQFYKDLCNSLFGKTIENQRKYKDIKLVLEQKLPPLVAKTRFDCAKQFDNGLHAVHLNKLVVKLDKPIYLGMTILDLSKVLMYDFHYNYMCKFTNKKLLFTDTDSLTYSVVTEDFYEDILPDLDNWFDTSGYDKSHKCYSEKNKKVMGKFKDECNGVIVTEFVGLRPKLYSFKTDDKLEHKKAKGVDKATIKHELKHDYYVDCLKNKQKLKGEVTRITSENHQLHTKTSSKILLSYDDDKRFILRNGIDTLAWGHYAIPQ